MTIQQAYANLKIKVDLIPEGASNRPGRPLKVEYITIHNTDNDEPGANARAHARYVKGDDARRRKVSWHYTVDDNECYKHLPLSEQGFHAGTSQGNRVSVGIEICQYKGINQAAANDRAALLTALLLQSCDLGTDRVVPHKHWSGKNCPKKLLSKWGAFIEAVQNYLDQLNQPPKASARSKAAPVSSNLARIMRSDMNEIAASAQGAEEIVRANITLPGGESFALNARPDVPDFRDLMFVPTLVMVPPARTIADFKKANVPILDQGREGACTGFGLATVANYLIRQLNPKSTAEVSMRMLYEMARRYDEWEGENYEGSSARGAMKGWNKHGVCLDSQWPYSAAGSPGMLTTARAHQAAQIPMGAYFRVNHKDIVAMHAAITEVGILYATSQVHEGWQQVGPNGKIAFSPTVIGGHAFAIVGYDAEGFWIQNSWGPGWGFGGYGHITYEDWLENGSDVWVARLGVPVAITSAGGAAVASQFLVGEVKPATFNALRPHVVCLDNDGLLAQTGAFANDAETVEDIITKQIPELTKGWDKCRVLVYAHGGLVEESGFLSLLAQYRETMMAKQVYPLCIVWRTGLFEVLGQMLQDQWDRHLLAGGPLEIIDELKDKVLEKVASPLGTPIWKKMKNNAISATVSRDGGARLIAEHLADLASVKKERFEVHAAGHSAGSILLSTFLQKLSATGPIRTGPLRASTDPESRGFDEMGLGVPVQSCTLWAPAIRHDLFNETYAPMMRARTIDRLAMYMMTDEFERKDTCLNAYGKSLLYLVSNAFEGANGTPIVGMEKFLDSAGFGLPKTTVVKARYDPIYEFKPGSKIPDIASKSMAHGDFDNDAATLWSTLARIYGTPSITI